MVVFIQTGGSWSSGATELFKQNCKGRLTYLPTEDPDHITLIVRLDYHIMQISKLCSTQSVLVSTILIL